MSDVERAIIHILNLRQTNPDVGYYIGYGTEAFRLLCIAEAAITNRKYDEIEEERSQDKQPSYSKRKPDVMILRKWKELAMDKLDCDAIEEIESELQKWEEQ